MTNEIKLGDSVKCKYTGFKGVAVARTEYINGCIQYTVVPKVGEDNKYDTREICIDSQSLEVIKKPEKKKEIKKDSTGGSTRISSRMRGY